jgi:nicotinamide-nucleotide amidase
VNAEIVAVGSEMLTPTRLDTNSLFLTDHLNALGVEVVAKRIVGDDRARLTEAVRHALSAAEIVIVTGGLGPTEDDVTRDAVAAALGRGMEEDEQALAWIADRFARMKRTMAPNNRRQAMRIEGAVLFDNPRGTAPGQWLETGGKVVALLPGPPNELRPMTENHLLPRLRSLLPPMVIAVRQFRVAGMGESDVDALIAPVYTRYTNPVTTILAKAGDVQVHLRARAAEASDAEELCARVAAEMEPLLGDRIYSRNGDPLEAAVGALLKARGETVAVAESCTGGMLGARLTEVPGSSGWFAGGSIVYSREAKQALIGEFEEDPVSEPVARRLAEAAARTATWGVSITGVAGPGSPSPDLPVGLVWIGLASAAGSEAKRFEFLGDRARIRTLATQTALNLLRLRLASPTRSS